jgi:diamine N-acetyltransferase
MSLGSARPSAACWPEAASVPEVAKAAVPALTGDRVRLRLLEEADLPRTLAWRNQPHIRRWFVNGEVITPEQHGRWFDGYRERNDDYVFIIEEAALPRRPVGQVSLYHIEWDRRRAEFGRLLIGEADATGRGLAREATALLIAHATTTWGIREIELEVFADNARAIALYSAQGFREDERRGPMLRMLRIG